MDNLASLHPIVVHFVIALGFVGVAFRVVSLLPILPWTRYAATTLLLLAAGAGALAAKSGEEAHGPAERIPGARNAVKEHEESGEEARNLLLAVAAIEVVFLALRKREKVARGLMALSAVVGIGASVFLFEAGEHGGELVYEYAGGIGTRSGTLEPEAVKRLLVAGLFHQARVARDSGHADESARLIDELVRQHPTDPMVQLIGVESQLKDKGDAAGALMSARAVQGPADQVMFASRQGVLVADAFVALGQTDSARTVLTALQAKFPESRSVKNALEKLK